MTDIEHDDAHDPRPTPCAGNCAQLRRDIARHRPVAVDRRIAGRTPQRAPASTTARRAGASCRGRSRRRGGSSSVSRGSCVRRPPQRPSAKIEPQLLSHEADGDDTGIPGALKVIAAACRPAASGRPALQELDRSAAQIRSALAARSRRAFPARALRRTYTRRLALTQRAALDLKPNTRVDRICTASGEHPMTRTLLAVALFASLADPRLGGDADRPDPSARSARHTSKSTTSRAASRCAPGTATKCTSAASLGNGVEKLVIEGDESDLSVRANIPSTSAGCGSEARPSRPI